MPPFTIHCKVPFRSNRIKKMLFVVVLNDPDELLPLMESVFL